VKILAKLDIAEKRLPQDGRIKIKMKLSGKVKELDYRVSVLPPSSARRSSAGFSTKTTSCST